MINVRKVLNSSEATFVKQGTAWSSDQLAGKCSQSWLRHPTVTDTEWADGEDCMFQHLCIELCQ